MCVVIVFTQLMIISLQYFFHHSALIIDSDTAADLKKNSVTSSCEAY